MFPVSLARGAVNLLSSTRFVVIGDSMRPTLAHQQHVQTVSLRLPWNCPRRGDIVVLRHPHRKDRIYIKRVVGLPLEYIQVRAEGVFINDRPLAEPYLNGPAAAGPGLARSWFTDENEYFVMGDNRRDSQDSRSFGPVGRELLLGRVWFRYRPFRVWSAPEPDRGQP